MTHLSELMALRERAGTIAVRNRPNIAGDLWEIIQSLAKKTL